MYLCLCCVSWLMGVVREWHEPRLGLVERVSPESESGVPRGTEQRRESARISAAQKQTEKSMSDTAVALALRAHSAAFCAILCMANSFQKRLAVDIACLPGLSDAASRLPPGGGDTVD